MYHLSCVLAAYVIKGMDVPYSVGMNLLITLVAESF